MQLSVSWSNRLYAPSHTARNEAGRIRPRQRRSPDADTRDLCRLPSQSGGRSHVRYAFPDVAWVTNIISLKMEKQREERVNRLVHDTYYTKRPSP